MNISKYLFSIKHTVLGMFILPLLFIAETNAEIYKWVDAEGNVHYGQQRPRDADAERLDIQQEPTTTFHSGKKDTVKSDTTAQNGEQQPAEEPVAPQEEKKVETPAEKKQRLEACARARKSLATMESIGRIRSKDAEGNYSYLSQQQKEAQMKQARDLIKKYCY